MGSVPEVGVMSLDNWEELLDPPRSVSVIRAHGNWQTKLAAANVSVINPDEPIDGQRSECVFVL